VYAPGVQGYKPMVLDLESSEDAEFMPAIYPKPKILYLPAIKERVPVFEGKFRIAGDAKIAATPQFMKLLGANGKSMRLLVSCTIRLRQNDVLFSSIDTAELASSDHAARPPAIAAGDSAQMRLSPGRSAAL
jgi:hypothetical protein